MLNREGERVSGGLPERAAEILASLGEHRILSTEQVRQIHLPDRSSRRARQVLGALQGAGLVRQVSLPRSPRRLWFLSEAGGEIAAGELRAAPKLLRAEDAAGPLRAHTFAVNQIGIAFLKAARERGEEFGPLSWRHEVAHPLSEGRGRARRTLFADAVLTYLREEGEMTFVEQRFAELDRNTLSVERLAAELARYAELHRACDKSGEPLWRRRYPRFPGVLCVLAGGSAQVLERRRDVALALLASDPQVERTPGVGFRFCLLEELEEHGPFAPIFRSLREPERAVNWIGQGKVGAGGGQSRPGAPSGSGRAR